MGKVRIVTDSSVRFENSKIVDQRGISIVPLSIRFDQLAYQENIDISDEEVIQRMRLQNMPPQITAPTPGEFEAVYQRLSKTTDQICVLVSSQQFTDAFRNAQSARGSLLGRCDIAVIDSLTTSAGLGYLVERVAEAAETSQSLEEVVRVARSTIPRVYSIYYVDSLEYVEQADLLGKTQSILGTMLELKPILTIEDGGLIVMEKARTHSQAIDKLIEFVSEFTEIDRIAILQNTLRTTDRTRMLQDRLALEFAGLQAPLMLYEPLIGSYLGPDAMGVAVLEGADSDF